MPVPAPGGEGGDVPGHVGWLEFTHYTGRRVQISVEDGATEITTDVSVPGDPDLHTHFFAAVRPGTDDGFALVLPEATAETMDLFLERFSETLSAGVHAALVLDGAGWHGKAALNVPDNITLLTLPPYSPELNPVERVWLYLRERYLSFRLHQKEEAIVDALCTAWNALRAETGRLKTLTSYPWITRAREQVET